MSDDILPPDRADEAPVTAPLRELMRLLQRTPDHHPSIEIECDPDAYDKLRTYFARAYRAQPTTFCLPVGGGTVWFRRAAQAQAVGIPVVVDPQLAPAEAHIVPCEPPRQTSAWLQARIDGNTSVAASEPATVDAGYGGPWKGDKA